jgi:hypothetical protein
MTKAMQFIAVICRIVLHPRIGQITAMEFIAFVIRDLFAWGKARER